MKNHFILHKIMIVLLGLYLTVPLATQAAQDNNFQGDRQVVSYADLDLASNEAVVVLYQRLKHAAQSVCGTVVSSLSPAA